MTRFAKVVVALLCIVCVLTLCIAPYVDLPLTILKSIQIILLLLFSLAVAELNSDSLFNATLGPWTNARTGRASQIHVIYPPLETNCVLQC